MSMGMQSVVFSDVSPQEKQEMMKTVAQTVELQQGKELDSSIQTQTGSGSGYSKKGSVYQDPTTGKLIMIQGS